MIKPTAKQEENHNKLATEVELVADEKPATAEEEKKDDHVICTIRDDVGIVAEMQGIEGFRQDYLDKISSLFLSFKGDLDVRGSRTTSRFYKVPMEIRNLPGSEGLYDPTIVDLLNIRTLLEKDNYDELRHYYFHLFFFLTETRNNSSKDAMQSLKDVMQRIYEKREELARCYEPNIAIDFLHLLALLIGGCFVFDTILRCSPFRASELWVDLLLLDNQIPFFILEIFYRMSYGDHVRYPTEKLVFNFFKNFLPLNKQAFLRRKKIEEEPNRVVHHLLHLVHVTLLPDSNDFKPKREPHREPVRRAIPAATRLRKAGVQFRPVKEKGFILGFDRGVLKLPHLHVRKNTKKVLMNLIVWEQFCCEPGAAYVTNYAILMDYLVNTSKDIEILIKSGVLDHSLAADEEVAGVFNTLGESLRHTKTGEMFEPTNFIWKLSNELNDYCENRYNIWRGTFAIDLFGSPMSAFTVVTTIYLFLFTVLQTYYAVASYYQDKK